MGSASSDASRFCARAGFVVVFVAIASSIGSMRAILQWLPSLNRQRAMRVCRGLVVALAVAYAAALLVVILVLRFAGPRVWQAELALYLPRVLFAIPLPFAINPLVIVRP